ncbi:unnamed protein product [marine sediment metagenome]|uniref:Major facilitator superfamily (MFS) profile domain-containing protein n=1 Tax=marine sediment metagenome TaxID=412755 RepID=X1RRD6_9ZZZZ
MNKLLYAGIVILSLGAVGTLLAVILEIQTGEPVYWLLMKITAGLFGVGGPVIGIAVAKRRMNKRD